VNERTLRTASCIYAQLDDLGRRQGIPLSKYDGGATYEAHDDQGHYWIARGLDESEDQTLGWVDGSHFRP
jgi:hypothetical protein